MIRVVCATGNKNKMREIGEILAPVDIEVCSMKDMGIDADIEENGTSFYENALIKARAVQSILREQGRLGNDISDGFIVMSDDSGLVIDHLDGMPGIYSARFAGEDTSYEIKNRMLIDKLYGVPDEKRTARFTCCMVAVLPDGDIIRTDADMDGIIAHEPAGCGGFGYDPILYLPELGCTSAELSEEYKNEISHRGKALREMAVRLSQLQK